MVATQAFITSMSEALCSPLVSKPRARQAVAAAATPTPSSRRSTRIAKLHGTSTVRPSKRGEALMMRKLGVLPQTGLVTQEERKAYRELVEAPLSKNHIAAIRELFPAANALTDVEVLTALQAGAMVAGC